MPILHFTAPPPPHRPARLFHASLIVSTMLSLIFFAIHLIGLSTLAFYDVYNPPASGVEAVATLGPWEQGEGSQKPDDTAKSSWRSRHATVIMSNAIVTAREYEDLKTQERSFHSISVEYRMSGLVWDFLGIASFITVVVSAITYGASYLFRLIRRLTTNQT